MIGLFFWPFILGHDPYWRTNNVGYSDGFETKMIEPKIVYILMRDMRIGEDIRKVFGTLWVQGEIKMINMKRHCSSSSRMWLQWVSNRSSSMAFRSYCLLHVRWERTIQSFHRAWTLAPRISSLCKLTEAVDLLRLEIDGWEIVRNPNILWKKADCLLP